MSKWLFIVVVLGCSVSGVFAQNVKFRDTRTNYAEAQGKEAKEQGQSLRLKNFSQDKKFETGEVRLKSFLTRDFEGGKKAVGLEKNYVSRSAGDADREALFKVGSREEVDAAFAAAEEKAREDSKVFGAASREFPDLQKIYEPRTYTGPETQKDKKPASVRNIAKPNLTVDEVKDLLNSPGSSREDISGR
ncbi:hypothetical protein QQ054_15995 [Oscillatoria amoena NRMC-F 0135]|nr:hypothetical protein [Oscillatoria laete-virens]MDL5047518.1 hypothetical protein [Oscillatoria amoena NRMC-F 0135]MDL5054657.1 hypothetical protein [Oscillatoria laete-virens NRMC-F 0139]